MSILLSLLVNDLNLQVDPLLFRTISLANLITLSPPLTILRVHSSHCWYSGYSPLPARGRRFHTALQTGSSVIVGRMKSIVCPSSAVVPRPPAFLSCLSRLLDLQYRVCKTIHQQITVVVLTITYCSTWVAGVYWRHDSQPQLSI